jgi:DNA-binding transcriptional ArsR family regulator
VSSDRYPSVPERITWTTGFRLPVDKAVLGTLSTFANFRTGKHADMWLDTLVARAKMSRSTVLRALQRLEEDGWITARRRHRHRTVYDINVDRLATHWMEAKVVGGLSVTGDTQEAGLSVTGDTQGSDRLGVTGEHLSVTGDIQTPILSVTGDTPRSPVRTDPQFDHKEPALRAVPSDQTESTTPTLFAETEAKVNEAKDERAPHQPTLGLLVDVSPPPPARDPNWSQRLAETIRTALRRHG